MRILALVTLAALTGAPALAQDAGHGEKIFKKCKACHMIGPKAKNRVGPVLTGVLGRPAGSYEGYHYGESMTLAARGGLIWTEDTLLEWLAGPTDFLRKTLDDPKAKAKMSFHLKKEQDRRDVIAYLATFSPTSGTTKAAAPASATTATAAVNHPGKVCVLNSTDQTLFFAAEAGDGSRTQQDLSPGAELCAEATAGTTSGMIGVYENIDAFEGCSRLVNVGVTDVLQQYVSFDRCFWASNT